MSKAGSLLVAIIVLHVAPIFCTRWICAEAQNLQQSGRPAKPTAAQEDAGTKAFKAGVKFQEQKQYAQALVEYRKASALLPDDPSILWNAGMCAYFTKVYPYALTAWSRMKAMDPTDDIVRGKLIVVYQAQGNARARNQERAELVTLRKSKKNAKLSAKSSYCCDQFVVAGRDVFAYDFFELLGEHALRYNFLVLKADGTTDYRISVGSYDLDNALAHELGHIKAGQRVYHLDGYYEQGHKHRTFRFYDAEPSYDAAKKDVVSVLQGTMKALSGSTRP